VQVVGAVGQALPGPAFEQHDLPVDGRQRAAGHEQVAQVRGGPPAVQTVEPVVGQRHLAAGQGLEVAGQAWVVVQPVQCPVGLGHREQAVGERLQRGADSSGAVVELLVERALQLRSGAGERPAWIVGHWWPVMTG
jgi:hypothetical protein